MSRRFVRDVVAWGLVLGLGLVVAPCRAQEVNQTPLTEVELVRAFPKVKPRRPVAFAHAGDGSGRLFIVSEYGQVQFLAGPDATELVTFLDIEPQVDYEDKENEEGLLGLAFHPKYKENGQFFVYYTAKEPPHTSVDFAVHGLEGRPEQGRSGERRAAASSCSSRSGITTAGPWRFGPDGFLYIAVGDGGARTIRTATARILNTLLGKILRIDVDHKDGRQAVRDSRGQSVRRQGGRSAGDLGLWPSQSVAACRSIARPARCGSADVGQDFWEEIDIVDQGGQLRLEHARGLAHV